MAICKAQGTSRSNSDLLRISMIVSDTSLSSLARMEIISRIVAEWGEALEGSVARVSAREEADEKSPSWCQEGQNP